jgi:UDP-2-acetamido-3-amino-2,3-dideoxy-glucuronate N-acetyltransferase
MLRRLGYWWRLVFYRQVISDAQLGKRVKVWWFVNLYGCKISDDTMVGSFVEIQPGVEIGQRCRIQSHTFIPAGVTIGHDVFIGHHVVFINDKHPTAEAARAGSWQLSPVVVEDGASVGSGAIINGGVTIHRGARVGAGAVVTRDVPPGVTVVGNPARPIKTKASD